MKLIKCPRCELNYITENEKYCKVCLREMKGETPKDEVELCSVCNEAPALPGRDVCLFCLKEMGGDDGHGHNEETEEPVDSSAIAAMDSVSTMDEIIPEIDDDIPSQEYGEIENELSLESVREDEENQDDDDEEEDDQ